MQRMQLHSLLEKRMIPGLNSANPYSWKRVKSTKLFRWVQSMKGEGWEVHQRDLGFFSKQGRKILRHILGSSIEEDARKGVKMGVYQGICSLQASLLPPFLHYCPDSPQQQKERPKLNTSISELSLTLTGLPATGQPLRAGISGETLPQEPDLTQNSTIESSTHRFPLDGVQLLAHGAVPRV